MRLLANQLSATRLALVPALLLLAWLGRPVIVGAVLALAAFTDLLDGFVARRTHTTTRFGSALDATADHLLFATSALLLVALEPAFVREQAMPLAAWAVLAGAALATGWVRHRRLGNLHLYSGKLAGPVWYLFVTTLLVSGTYSRTFFAVALGLAFLAAAEMLLEMLARARVDEHAGSILRPERPLSVAGRPGDSAPPAITG
ncbi:MAG TPA: CDP-alcohol phosphatidyltransferase family protein [Longimicrobium sp.]|nr:CDP-alcohol phosphatidyltransferase family protein [Longimicrobium sp.]